MTVQRPDLISIFLSELLGTGLLLFMGCGGCLAWGAPPNGLLAALNFGLVVMVIIQIFGCVSGAHLNPIVTIAARIYKQITFQTAAVYISAQLLGAFMGFGLLKVLTPARHFPAGQCMTVPHPELSVVQAIAIEFLASAILLMFCCGVWDPRNAHTHDSVGLRFGLLISSLAFTFGPFTGASMNPVRSLAPALWQGDFTALWIYWVGPLAAAVITPYLYQIIFQRPSNGVTAISQELEHIDLNRESKASANHEV